MCNKPHSCSSRLTNVDDVAVFVDHDIAIVSVFDLKKITH